MKESNTIRRIPPCAAYDVEGMESWLYDMAQEGLFLEKDGISCGIACFQRGEPRTVHYRLESARTDPTAMEVLISGDSKRWMPPDKEEADFHAGYGWEYVAQRGMFHIYQHEGEVRRELNTDPVVQAVSVSGVRKWRIWILLWVVVALPDTWWMWQRMVRSGSLSGVWAEMPYYLVSLLAVLICFVLGLLIEVTYTHRIYRKLKGGTPLDHHKDWRKTAPWYYLSRILMIGSVILLILSMAVSYFMIR